MAEVDPWAGFTYQPGAAAAPEAAQADPWAGFTNQGPNSDPELRTAKGDNRTAFEKLKGINGPRYQLWPERLARDLGSQIIDALKLPGEVYQGKVDITSPEGMNRAIGAASMVTPGAEVAGTGRAIARRALTPGAVNPEYNLGLEAARTAADIGAPLPAGIVSQVPGIQSATQAGKQVPFAGDLITNRVLNTAKAAGEKVRDIASELYGGDVADRAITGASTKNALKQAIEDNNDTIDSFYDDLRNNHIKPNMFSSVQNTKAVLADIGAKRWTAGEDRQSGLADIERLISSGKPFDGLIRARSKVGADLGANKANPNPGFPTGDLKRLYGALSTDIENAVQAPTNLRPGVNASDALAAFRTANDNAKDLIESNANLQRLINVQSDERMLGGIIGMANAKSGNARLLGELRGQLPDEDFQKVVGAGLNELGHDNATGEFDLRRYGRQWNEMSPSSKSILISDPLHRQALDRLANLGSYLSSKGKFENTSSTARAALLGGTVATAGGAILSMDPIALLKVFGGLGGGYTLGKILARPASAKALDRWVRTGYGLRGQKSVGSLSRSAVERTTRDLVTELQGVPGFDPEEAQQALQQTTGPQPRSLPQITVTAPKDQGRISPNVGR